MNRLYIALSFVASLFFFTGCKEVGPAINLGRGSNSVADTTYIESPVQAAEEKNVVIEEFTGVRCPNCPHGHQIIKNIKTANPDRVIALSLHPINSLGAPYPFSPQNFQQQKAQSMFDYLGQIGLEPAGGIDRKLFNGETNVLLHRAKWTTNTNAQLALTTPVNITLDKIYDSLKNEVTIIVELRYTQTVTEANRLTVALTESDMIAPQLNGSIIDTFYTHNDVMRDFITGTLGDDLNVTLEPGRLIRKIYKKTLESLWKPENMHIVAYVHEFQNSKTIYQGKEIKLK